MENFNQDSRVMSVKDWVITLLLMMIPVANIVLLILWAIGSDVNKNKQNWAKASIFIFLISLGIIIVLSILFTVIGISLYR